jgi:mannosyltransferase OCH1-like enzyme
MIPCLQRVPHVIWQTWKSAAPGPKRFEGMDSFVRLNPEYDYALFTDEDCERFMCELAMPDVRRAYEVSTGGKYSRLSIASEPRSRFGLGMRADHELQCH